MATETFDILYAAHTASCTFLLDAEGVCRRIVTAPHVKRRESQTAVRCIGAQYVASLDAAAAGCLVEMPRVGASMLFARVDERGRVSLVRTGPCTRFEQTPAQDPFESVSVRTSAPEITPRTQPSRAPHADDPDYFDASDRTVRIHALAPEELVPADEGSELTTAEYALPGSRQPTSSQVRESPTPRNATASARAGDALPTLRNPPRDGLEDEENPYGRNPRGMLPAARHDSSRLRAAEAAGAAGPTRRRR